MMDNFLHSFCLFWIALIFCETVNTNENLPLTIEIINLEGTWNVFNSNQSIDIPATVPGNIYTDLQDAHVIGDPYYRFNDAATRWVAYDNWTYSHLFNVSSSVLQHQRVVLRCEGLDTVSSIYINNQHVGSSNNMFIHYHFDVKSVLQEGENNITVSFMSPVLYANNEWSQYKSQKGYSLPPECPQPVQNGECHGNFIRKMQSSFSWDWGPAFPGVGIWKTIKIEAFDLPVVRDFTVVTEKDESSQEWTLRVRVFVTLPSTATYQGAINIQLEDFTTRTNVSLTANGTQLNTDVEISVTIPKSKSIELWWPSGMEELGSPKLYPLSVTFTALGYGITSNKSVYFGFRTIQLVQDPVLHNNASEGLTFFFLINGYEIYLKGSNWIPADSFPTRVTDEYLEYLMKSAHEVGINVLRVWGGGLYETDQLYQLADQLGILIWQDLMFACAMYPAHPEFLESANTEVRQQVRRLQHHPSILLWSANNENELALVDNWYFTKSNFSRFKEDYITLYITNLMDVVQSEDQTRPFLPSSPSNGQETETEGWVASNPASTVFGDVHYYQYTMDGWDWTIYPLVRMTTEYGYQSWTSFKLLANYSTPQDWTYNSEFMSSRQHHIFGNIEMTVAVKRHFKLPELPSEINEVWYKQDRSLAEQKVFDDTLWLTQVTQAVGVKVQTEFYRRSRSKMVDNQGFNMGCLYWQLNDIWPGASWSSIEYGGRWKVLHYMVKEMFSRYLVSPYVDTEGNVRVEVVSDSYTSRTMILITSVYLWNSLTPVYNKTNHLTHPGQSSQLVYTESLSGLVNVSSCPSIDHCFLWFTLTDSNDHILSTNFLLPTTSFADVVGLVKPDVKVTVVKGPYPTPQSTWTFDLTLSTDTVAPFLWIDTDVPGYFSTNGFIMKDNNMTLQFFSREYVHQEGLSSNLQVRSLMDVYSS